MNEWAAVWVYHKVSYTPGEALVAGSLAFPAYSWPPGREVVWGVGKGPRHLGAQPAYRQHFQSLNSGQGRGSVGAWGLTWDHVVLDFVSDRALKAWQAWPSGWVPSPIKKIKIKRIWCLWSIKKEEKELVLWVHNPLLKTLGAAVLQNSEFFRFLER